MRECWEGRGTWEFSPVPLSCTLKHTLCCLILPLTIAMPFPSPTQVWCVANYYWLYVFILFRLKVGDNASSVQVYVEQMAFKSPTLPILSPVSKIQFLCIPTCKVTLEVKENTLLCSHEVYFRLKLQKKFRPGVYNNFFTKIAKWLKMYHSIICQKSTAAMAANMKAEHSINQILIHTDQKHLNVSIMCF